MRIVGVDIGGTFTDFILLDGKNLRIHKVLSTPSSPAEAMLQGLTELGALQHGVEIVHGSTVGTNALLERKGARCALVTTSGFEDVLEIARQNRPHLYDLLQDKPSPLIPAALRFGIRERIAADGSVLAKLQPREIRALLRRLKRADIEAVAVGLLGSFANPQHEELLARALCALGVPVCVSHRIAPEYREYERLSTAALSAYITPVMHRYLSRLERSLGGLTLRIMQSNGGAISARTARAEAARTVLSGPAGGVAGAFAAARQCGFPRIITFDMGGTSTDVALCDGSFRLTTASSVGGCPVRLPMIEIHTVGAGGGSIARADTGGALQVGPDSAGADPGPACYGKGTLPTVTDANVLLGRIDPAHFLGGRMALDTARCRAAVARLAKSLRLKAAAAAEGVIDVVNAEMQRAIRVISVQRGYDPRDFTLVSFGGAGGLHACDLAEALAIPRILVPLHAGLLSAFGMAVADTVKDYSRSVLAPAALFTASAAETAFRALERRALRDMQREGKRLNHVRLLRSLDARYLGQSFELNIPYTRRFAAAFHAAHLKTYGHSDPARTVEVVTTRVQAVCRGARFVLPALPAARGRAVPFTRRTLRYRGRTLSARVYHRADLRRGVRLAGPAIIHDESSTTLVTPSFQCEVHPQGHLILTRRRA